MKCKECKKLLPKVLFPIKWRNNTPFSCEGCGTIEFPYRAFNDFVFIWPIPLPSTYIENGLIERPQSHIDATDEVSGRSDYGVILSVGPGYCDNKKFYPNSFLEQGMKVIYDKTVPWREFVETDNGTKELVVICGYKDVRAIVEE